MIIAVLNQKGGAGKTTICLNLAHALAKKKYKVLLVDSDPQGSARDWAAAREEKSPFNLIALDRPVLHKELPGISDGYDFAIIDGAPGVAELSRSAIIAADFVLIPVQPSPLDVWAVHEVIKLLEEASIYKDIHAAFIINRKITNTKIGDDVSEVLGSYNYPVLKSYLSQRIVFASSLNSGLTVLETAPKSPASKEILSLTKELIHLIS